MAWAEESQLPAQALTFAGLQSPAILTSNTGGQESLYGKLDLWKAMIGNSG